MTKTLNSIYLFFWDEGQRPSIVFFERLMNQLHLDFDAKERICKSFMTKKLKKVLKTTPTNVCTLLLNFSVASLILQMTVLHHKHISITINWAKASRTDECRRATFETTTIDWKPNRRGINLQAHIFRYLAFNSKQTTRFGSFIKGLKYNIESYFAIYFEIFD